MPEQREYQICPSGGSIGWRFGVDSESASDLSCRIGMSETAECREKVQCTSARPHVDLVPVENGTGTCLMRADMQLGGIWLRSSVFAHFCSSSLPYIDLRLTVLPDHE
jgi:hypothetical protein